MRTRPARFFVFVQLSPGRARFSLLFPFFFFFLEGNVLERLEATFWFSEARGMLMCVQANNPQRACSGLVGERRPEAAPTRWLNVFHIPITSHFRNIVPFAGSSVSLSTCLLLTHYGQ